MNQERTQEEKKNTKINNTKHKKMKFQIKIILDVSKQSVKDMKRNAVNYIIEDIEDKCLYIEDIKIIKTNKKNTKKLTTLNTKK